MKLLCTPKSHKW